MEMNYLPNLFAQLEKYLLRWILIKVSVWNRYIPAANYISKKL